MNDVYNISIGYTNENSYDVADHLVSKGFDLTKGKFFRAKASSSYSYRLPEYTLDNSNEYFCSLGNDSSPWIQFEFSSSAFLIQGYSIRSTGSNYLKSFLVEGFDKHNHKEVIDTQPDVGTNILGVFKYFEVKNKVRPNRIIRFSMIGPNGEGNPIMCAIRFKLFGVLYPNVYYQRVSCRVYRRTTYKTELLFILLIS